MAAPGGVVEELELRDYVPYIAGGPRVRVFMGARVALVIDEGCTDLCASLHGARNEVRSLVIALESLLRGFDFVVGRSPALSSPLYGRVRVEVAFLPGAAGLAHHGSAGFAVGPAFVESWLRSAASGAPQLAHVFTYECCRNYIFPEEFTAVFDYHCREGEASWGWVNQGFVNVLGCLICVDGGVAFDYHGFSAEQFLGQMEAELLAYVRGMYAWTDAFEHDRLPWKTAHSLDNLYSGLLVSLWRRHGRRRFLRRWFTGAIPLLLARCPAGKGDVATARENFFLAACYAAGADLSAYFVGELRWPLRASISGPAGGVLGTMLAAAAADSSL